jgi:group I intron endonuclease
MTKKITYFGIYEVKNLINDKSYIGQSAIDVHGRCLSHIKHIMVNNDNRHLINAVNKYGIKNFSFKVILYCEQFELTRYEDGMINCDRPNRYNIRPAADSNKGLKMSEDIINKHRLENLSEETRHKMSTGHLGNTALLGYVPTEETRIQMSLAQLGNQHLKGHIQSEETRRKISDAWKKRKLAATYEEFRHKLSEAHKGNTALLGHKHTEETKRKMSEAHKLRRQKEHDIEDASLVCEEVIDGK